MEGGREYARSHPWITFRVNLGAAGPRTWALLGEAVARCRQVSQAALPPAAAAEMDRLYLTRGARATTAIEGNTLTDTQVRARLEGQLELPPSQEYLGREVDNVLAACKSVLETIRAGQPPRLSRDLIAEYNRRVLAGLEEHLDAGVVPGEIPRHRVVVGRYRGAPRQDCAYLLDRTCAWLEQERERAPAGLAPAFANPADGRLAMAVLQAILAHLYVAWIHPFGDGNGRTARLLEFMLLARSGVPAPAAHLLSNHYNLTRAEYYRQLDRSSRANDQRGAAAAFVEYALQGFVDRLREQCAYVANEQLVIAWQLLVHVTFDAVPPTAANARRHALVLALSAHQQPAPKAAIPELTPALARSYATKTDKTLTRDLNWLRERDLVARTAEGYRARIERMRGFQPNAAPP